VDNKAVSSLHLKIENEIEAAISARMKMLSTRLDCEIR
jgi:hypothetical protein